MANGGIDTKIVSQEDADKAIETLVAFGKNKYDPEYNPTRGQCIGIAISALSNEVIDISTEMLEDWNYHVIVAIINVIAEKTKGKFKRKGRQITIELPEWWK